MSARLTRTVEWEDSGKPRLPWKAKVDSELWQVRLNEFPGSTHLYALLVDGAVAEQFQQWPETWKKPVDEYLKRDFEDEQARFEYQRHVGPSKLVEQAAPVTKSVDHMFAEIDAKNPSNEFAPTRPKSVDDLLAALDVEKKQAEQPTPFAEIAAMRRRLRERARKGLIAKSLIEDLLQYADALETAHNSAAAMQLGAEGFDNTDSARHYSDLREGLLATAQDIVRACKALVAKPKIASVIAKDELEKVDCAKNIPTPEPVQPPAKQVSVDQMFNALDRKNAKDLAKAERWATAHGKEPFVLGRLEELLHEAPGSRAGEEASLRRRYYILNSAIRTLAEYAKQIREKEFWDR